MIVEGEKRCVGLTLALNTSEFFDKKKEN